MKKLTFLLFLSFIFSCSDDRDIWVSEHKERHDTLFFDKKHIVLATEGYDDYGEKKMLHYAYEIVDTVHYEGKKPLCIYIIKNDSTHKYNVLPSYLLSDSTRKFDIRESYGFSSKEEALRMLETKIEVNRNGIDSAAFKHVFFGGLLGPNVQLFIKTKK